MAKATMLIMKKQTRKNMLKRQQDKIKNHVTNYQTLIS